MDQVHVVRHKVLVEGRSQRSVARELGLSRNTVQKYVEQAEPRRVEQGTRAKPVLARVRERLEALLEAWSGRSTRKQRVTGTRVHRQLLEEGFQVGVTTVREAVREWRRQRAEVYVPLVHRPGEGGQVDFFEVTVVVARTVRKAWKFLLHLPFSGRSFAWLYERCDQLSFLDGHVRAFAHLGGAPKRLVYDNLKAAVKSRVGIERELTERFLALSSHYLFEPCFARPGEGHDKGSVEGRGKGVRLQHLTPVPSGPSLRAMSEEVLSSLDRVFFAGRRRDGQDASALWEAEQVQLLPLPATPFEARQMLPVEVSSRGLIRILGAEYSVPSHWARLSATAYVGVDDVRVVCRDETTALAREVKGGRRVEYRHFLPELAKKPQAVRQVHPELIAELGEPYGQLWGQLAASHGELEAARLLAKVVGAMVDHGEEAVREAVVKAVSRGRCDLTPLRRPAEPKRRIAVPAHLAAIDVEARAAAEYDVLLAGGAQ